MAQLVHYRQFLDLVAAQDVGCVLQIGIVGGDQPLLGHHLLDRPREVVLEAEVTVGHDTDQGLVGRDDGNAADAVLLHQAQRVAHGIVLENGDRIIDHAVLGTFHTTHLGSLLLDGHVLMNHADTAFPSQRNGQRGFGDGIHGGGYDRYVQLDIARKPSGNVHLARQHLRIGRHQKDIVERQPFRKYSFINE